MPIHSKILILVFIGVFYIAFSACQARGLAIPVALAQRRPSSTPDETNSITIAAAGDIMLGSPFLDDKRMPPNDGADLLKNVTPILTSADIAFGNLEGPMIDSGDSLKCPKPKPVDPNIVNPKPPEPIRCYAFRMPTRYGKHLRAAGFDVLSVANNHAGDFGNAGRLSTRKVLDGLDIKHAGSDKARFSTSYLEVKGRKIAFIGFAHNNISANINNLAAARQLVLEADKKADIVVVSFHGGAEGIAAENVPNATEIYFGEKRGNLPLFAHTVIDAGADLVLGHGPHVLRGMEIYKHRLIAYSLGNFATYGWFKLENETALTMILEARLDAEGKFLGGKIHSAKQEGRGIPVLDESGEAIKKVRPLSLSDFGSSAPIISDDGKISPK